jgi:hypothetical protein
MTGVRDFRDDVAETLELIKAIHDRVVDGPLFPYPWASADFGRGPLFEGGSYTMQLPFSHPSGNLRIETRALDENRLELRFWMANMAGQRIVFEVCPT